MKLFKHEAERVHARKASSSPFTRPRRGRGLAVSLLFVVPLMAAAAAVAGDGFLIRSADSGASTYVGSANDDPIVFPGQSGATHLHDFFCNRETTAHSTHEQMVRAGTSCPSGDTAGYWAPALYKGTVKIDPLGPPTRQQVYYRNSNYSSGTRVEAFPPDFKMVVGKAKADTLAVANAIDPVSGIGAKIGSEQYWGCSNNSESGKPTVPVNCSSGIIALHVGFPTCWNGVKVAGDQIAAGTMRWSSGGVCPTGFSRKLPRLIERFEYQVGTSSTGITLASGNVYSVHADFWNTWQQAKLECLVERSLNAGVELGTNPTVCDDAGAVPPPLPPPPSPPVSPLPPAAGGACKLPARQSSGLWRLDLASYPAGLTQVVYVLDGAQVAEDHTSSTYDEAVAVSAGQHSLVCRAVVSGLSFDSAPLVFTGG